MFTIVRQLTRSMPVALSRILGMPKVEMEIPMTTMKQATPHIDPDLAYAARHPVPDDLMFDVVHRHGDAMKEQRNTRSIKQGLFENIIRHIQLAYADVQQPHAVSRQAAGRAPHARCVERTHRGHASPGTAAEGSC